MIVRRRETSVLTEPEHDSNTSLALGATTTAQRHFSASAPRNTANREQSDNWGGFEVQMG